ncbi:hypothetical protein ABKV19_017135, partial [Rosa sericea]
MERKGEFVSAVPRIAQLILLMKNIPGDWGFDCCISYGDLEFSAKEEGVLFSAKANFQDTFHEVKSKRERRKEDKALIMQLLAVACLSLAAKMEEINVPISLDLQ